jgi:hypothetical protein
MRLNTCGTARLLGILTLLCFKLEQHTMKWFLFFLLALSFSFGLWWGDWNVP